MRSRCARLVTNLLGVRSGYGQGWTPLCVGLGELGLRLRLE